MYFRQVYLGCLAHASYLIGSGTEAAVVDPQRDIDIYLEDAKAHGFEIKHVIETHCHADFISGHHELAARTGAKIYFGARAAAKFDFVPVHEGDEIVMNDLVLRFLETPGHTPESVSVLVFDLEQSKTDPYAVLSGTVEPGLHSSDGTVVAEASGLRLHGFQFTPLPPSA